MTTHNQMFSTSAQPVLENQHGEDVVVSIDGREPKVCIAIVTQEERSRRDDSKGGIRTVRERMATVSAGLAIEDFDSLLAAKLHATVSVSGVIYAVESSAMDGNSIAFTIIRDGVSEIARPGYRGYGR